MNELTQEDFAKVRPVLVCVTALVVLHALLTSPKEFKTKQPTLVDDAFNIGNKFMEKVEEELL